MWNNSIVPLIFASVDEGLQARIGGIMVMTVFGSMALLYLGCLSEWYAMSGTYGLE